MKEKISKCVDCNKLISKKASRCKSCANKGAFNPFYGKKHTKETRKKLCGPRPDIVGEKNPNFGKGLPGEKNPNWRGGVGKIKYPHEFKAKSKLVRSEIKICQKCMADKSLVVHHIDYDRTNNKLDNLITLCRTCNSIVNYNRDYWYMIFKYKIHRWFIARERYGNDCGIQYF